MHLLALPNESLAAVAERCPPPALVALGRVNRRLHAVAERVLYANVLENLLIPVFIGQSRETVPFLASQGWGASGPTYTFNFDGRRIDVKGV